MIDAHSAESNKKIYFPIFIFRVMIVITIIITIINWLCHKEGHADPPPPSEMTPSKSDCKWCAMF